MYCKMYIKSYKLEEWLSNIILKSKTVQFYFLTKITNSEIKIYTLYDKKKSLKDHNFF